MSSSISTYEKVFLDTRGVFYRKQMHSKQEINSCLEWFQNNKQRLLKTRIKSIDKYVGFERNEVFLKLITHQSIIDLCKIVFGENQFKLDHSFIVETRNVDPHKIIDLHGGTHKEWNIHYYHSYPVRNINDTPYIRSGQLTVGISLTPQNITTGGMVYVPGSHKTSYHVSGKEFQSLLQLSTQANKLHELLEVPELEPGDCVAFPESLIHGSYSSGEQNSSRVTLYGAYYPIGFNFNFDDSQRNRFRETAPDDKKNIFFPKATTHQNLLNLQVLNLT